MFDRDTLVITYNAERGEPRGSRSRKTDPAVAGLGHCVDCGICVQVCPTGIDIRKGLQYECIGCAACIDGCDQVMDKMGYPRHLISYSTENTAGQNFTLRQMWRRIWRPRVLVYSGVLWAIILTAAGSLWLRTPLKVDVIRDRAVLAREVEGGKIENVYRLQIMNTDETPHRFLISAKGTKDLEHLEVLSEQQPMEIGPASSRAITLRVRAEPEHDHHGSMPIQFLIEGSDDEKHPLPEVFSIREKSVFIVPR